MGRNDITSNKKVTYLDRFAIPRKPRLEMYQNNAVTCRLLVVCNFYFELAMYHWLLVEGIYLYMKVALVYNSERIKLWMYKLVGWVRVSTLYNAAYFME